MKKFLLRELISAIIFTIYWIIACLIADFVLKIESNCWAMMWGVFIGYLWLYLRVFKIDKKPLAKQMEIR